MRTTEHNHTPAVRQGNQAVTKSNQIPRGRDQRRNWARTPQGTNRREGKQQPAGRAADNSQTKDRHKETQPPQKGARRHGETPANAQAEIPAQRKHHQQGATHEGAKHKTKDKRRQGEHSPNQDRTKPTNQTQQKRGQEGRNRTEARKKTPPRRSKWEQITMWCPGTEGTGDKRQKRDNKTEEEKEGEGRYVKLRVVYSRWCCLSARRVSVQLFPIAKETGLVLSSLRHGAAVHYIWPERQPCQSLAFSYVIAYRGKPFLHMLSKRRFWHIMGWSLEEHPTRQPRAVDFPVGKH